MHGRWRSRFHRCDFLEETPADKIARYKNDLKFFMQLYAAVRRRYAEVVDFKEYEGKIQKLIDTHVGTGEVEKMTDLVNIFDAEAFANEVDKLGSTASKADTIAHRTKKTIEERMGEDPAFYQKFSELLAQAIAAFRQQRLSDAAYLSQGDRNRRESQKSHWRRHTPSTGASRRGQGVLRRAPRDIQQICREWF